MKILEQSTLDSDIVDVDLEAKIRRFLKVLHLNHYHNIQFLDYSNLKLKTLKYFELEVRLLKVLLVL